MKKRTITLLAALCTLAMALPSQGASTQSQKCQAAKLKAAGKKAACRLGAMAKLVTGGSADIAKCSTKFSIGFAKAEEKAGSGICPTEGDVDTLEARIDAGTAEIQGKLSSVRFVDNGDGTVTDNQTGLQWEKKVGTYTAAFNCTTNDCSGHRHDVNDAYRWTATTGAADGSVFVDFLGALNDCRGDASKSTPNVGGLAGHCDWRLPTVEELQTILVVGCPSSPCIDPVFGPTSTSGYWSATSKDGVPSDAWRIGFSSGSDVAASKLLNLNVRAVRGGW